MKSLDQSSVASLFIERENGRLFVKESCNTPPSLKKSERKACHSASKILDDYIRNYDKAQTIKLAKSMIEICSQTPLKRNIIQRDVSTTVDREIRMARSMLHTESSNASSLSTDDLLMQRSTFHVTNSQDEIKRRNETFQHSRPTSSVLTRKKASSVSSKSSLVESDTSSLASSSSLSLRSLDQRKSRRRARKTLRFTTNDDYTSSEDTPTLRSTPHPTDDSELREQILDLQRTWTLVDDLKVDLYSSPIMSDGHPKPPEDSLRDLIERLSAAAMRKEKKLQERFINRKKHGETLDYSDLLSSGRTNRFSTSSHIESFDGEHESVRRVRHIHPPHSSDRESVWSSSGLSEVVHMIDRRSHPPHRSLRITDSSRDWRPLETQRSKDLLKCAPTSHSRNKENTIPSFNDPSSDESFSERNTRKASNVSDDTSYIPLPLQLEGKSPAVCDFMEKCLTQDTRGKCGPVEALKNMIFTLQSLTSAEEGHIKGVDLACSDQATESDPLRRALDHLDKMKRIIEK